jgi:hypothetical protein
LCFIFSVFIFKNTKHAVVTGKSKKIHMFFVRRAHAKVREGEVASSRQREPASSREPLLPKGYDEFSGTKIHSIIQHPLPEGDRIYMRVPYACSAAAKELGARWDPDAKRWWHWSNSTAQLSYHDNPERWTDALLDAHAQSSFSQWPLDVDFTASQKNKALNLRDTFDYSNPRG